MELATMKFRGDLPGSDDDVAPRAIAVTVLGVAQREGGS